MTNRSIRPSTLPTHRHVHRGEDSVGVGATTTAQRRVDSYRCGKAKPAPARERVVTASRVVTQAFKEDAFAGSMAPSAARLLPAQKVLERATTSAPFLVAAAKPQPAPPAYSRPVPPLPPPPPLDMHALQRAIASGNQARTAQASAMLTFYRMPMTTHDGTPALIFALENDAPLDVIETLLRSGCRTDVLNGNGYTPLIMASAKGRHDVVVILLPYFSPADINHEASDGSTALLSAVVAGHAAVCQTLITAGAMVGYENYLGDTAVSIAYRRRHVGIERILQDAGAFHFPVPRTFASIREYRREAKRALMELGPVAPLLGPVGPWTASDIITSHTFCSDHRDRAWLNGAMHEVYAHRELQPLMDLVALCALGRHEAGMAAEAAGTKIKRLKVFCVPTLAMLLPQFKGGSYGRYTQRHSVFVATHGRSGYRDVVGTIVHEFAHFALLVLYQNGCKPFRADDAHAATRYDDVVATTHARLQGGILANRDADEAKAFQCINRVFTCYREAHYGVELVVRVPQIIALLGAPKGMAWLHANVPELLAYHLDVVTPGMIAYCGSHHAGHFILPPGPSVSPDAHRLRADVTAAKERQYLQKCAGSACAPDTPQAHILAGKRWPDVLGHLNP